MSDLSKIREHMEVIGADGVRTDDVVTRAVNAPVHGIRFMEASAGWL